MMRRKQLNNSGDTIVEVLISIAIVSLVLAIAFATANHNARDIQDAQERSQANQIAQRQIEFLKANVANELDTTLNQQCFAGDGSAQIPGSAQNDPCTVDANGSEISTANTNTDIQPQYTIKITSNATSSPPPLTTTYTITITWPSLLSSGNDTLTMYYRP